MRSTAITILSSVSILAVAAPAWAQETPVSSRTGASVDTSREIIVSARRRDESLQDVPQTVNVVTGETLEKLNIRDFTEIQSVVPGLTLTTNNSFSSGVSVRGVQFLPEASGNNPTVEFYLNDTPISSNFLFQSMFDVGQIDLQRGPQGTLRGRASPSGSFVVATRRPDLSEVGVVINATANTIGSRKIDGAFNIPIIADVLALRLAGVVDDTRGNRVDTIKAETDRAHNPRPSRDTQAIRASLRFEPTDWLSANVMYQSLHSETQNYTRVVSDSLITGSTATTRVTGPFDRLSIDDQGTVAAQDQDILVGNIDVRFAGQKLSYIGAHTKQNFASMGQQDFGDYFAPPRFTPAPRTFSDLAGFEQVCREQGQRTGYTPTTGAYLQCTHGIAKRDTHELRLASEDRIAGIFDYVVGVLYDRNNTPTRLTQETPLLVAPTRVVAVNLTAIERDGKSTEKSVYGNVTAHVTDQIELSGGLRYIDYKNDSTTFISGTPPTIQEDHDKLHATIYTASAKYNFNDNLMAYASIGSSWRPGPRAVGNFSAGISPRELSFMNLKPEKSTSYEIGLKTSFMDGRGRFNISYYHQDFSNYVYRGDAVNYVSYRSVVVGGSTLLIPSVASFNYLAGVPVKVDGVEADASFLIMPGWSITANAAYADGRIKDGTIACNDLNGDGIPDVSPTPPTLAALQAAVGPGQNVSQCSNFNGPSTLASKFSANIQSEYDFALNNQMGGFIRALIPISGATSGNPSNSYDHVGAYGLLNLFTGLRASDGSWEVSLFGKNILRERKMLTVGASPLSNSLTTLAFGPGGSVIGSSSSSFVSQYREISITPPREFGINLRVAFGSR